MSEQEAGHVTTNWRAYTCGHPVCRATAVYYHGLNPDNVAELCPVCAGEQLTRLYRQEAPLEAAGLAPDQWRDLCAEQGAQLKDLRARLTAAKEEIEGLDATLDAGHKAYKRGAERFRAAHPEYVERMMYPDTARLGEWLLEQLAEAEARAEQVETAARALVEVAYSEEGDMGVRWYAVEDTYIDVLAKVLGIERPGDLGGDE